MTRTPEFHHWYEVQFGKDDEWILCGSAAQKKRGHTEKSAMVEYAKLRKAGADKEVLRVLHFICIDETPRG